MDARKKASRTVTAEPVKLNVDIKPVNRWHSLLQKAGIKPKKKGLLIHPLCLGTCIRISRGMVGMDIESCEASKVLQMSFDIQKAHGRKVAWIIASAIHNKKSKTPKELVDFVAYNFSMGELMNVLTIVVGMMDVTSFMTTIFSIKGLNMMEKSLESKGEIIAPGTSLEA